MQFEFEGLPCNVWGDFKHGDNACYNAEILNALVANNVNGQFNKPIVLQVASLIEVATYQIFFRAVYYTNEGVQNTSVRGSWEESNLELTDADCKTIRSKKKFRSFKHIIEKLEEYKILDGLRDGIYEELDTLREYRNKIHIEASIENAPLDEKKQFTTKITKWAIELNWDVIEFLAKNYKRPSYLDCYVEGLTLPRLKKL